MRVQLLNPGEPTKQYAVIFYQGDEAFSGLLEFAQKYHITSAHFTAIGAVNGATLGWFDPQRKMYKKIPIQGQHEVIGMSGDIALYQGKPVVHTHMLVGNPDGTTQGGHVLAAYVSPTLEVMVTVDPVTMQKRFDPDTDLTLIDPSPANKEAIGQIYDEKNLLSRSRNHGQRHGVEPSQSRLRITVWNRSCRKM